MKKSVAIVGGGPASLSLAAFLDPTLFDVAIYEKNKTLGRKFLVAGKGGFNLTHGEPIEIFVQRYTPSDFLKDAILGFTNQDLICWLNVIGIPTFQGTSKRIFPQKGIKPVEVLNAITAVLKANDVVMHFGYSWTNWTTDNALIFYSGEIVKADYYVFALGGGSWKVTGSDGKWLEAFDAKGIKTRSFQSSNCAYQIHWPKDFIQKNEGRPLKNISIECGYSSQKGEVVITRFGLEGNAIYALSPAIQNELTSVGSAAIWLDLKPTLAEKTVVERLLNFEKEKTTDVMRNELNMSVAQISLLKAHTTRDEFMNPTRLAAKIKKLPLTVVSAAPLDEAISTTGGVILGEVNAHFELYNLKNTFCLGEMLDWNAPTGGYLLQACFSMGVHLARHLNQSTLKGKNKGDLL